MKIGDVNMLTVMQGGASWVQIPVREKPSCLDIVALLGHTPAFNTLLGVH